MQLFPEKRIWSSDISLTEHQNPHYGDLYFSSDDGMDETMYVFIQGNELETRLQKGGDFHVGETGFGTGLNLLSLLTVIPENPEKILNLSYSTVEKYPLETERIRSLLLPFKKRLGDLLTLFLKQWDEFRTSLAPGWNTATWTFPGGDIRFRLYFGDVLEWCLEEADPSVDAWFLDGHSPDKNPEIWSLPVMESLYRRTKVNGTLATFTSAGVVKQTLRAAGFTIKRKSGFARKRHMISGFKS